MTIIGLDLFGLGIAQLKGLKRRTATFTIQLKGPDLTALAPLTPRQRNTAVSKALQAKLHALTKRYRFDHLIPRDSRTPWTVDAKSTVDTLLALRRLAAISHISVEQISGCKRRRTRSEPFLHTVRALVAVEVEGQRHGMQTVEEVFMVVSARSDDDAKRILESHWADYATPYLNSSGQFVRWRMESILEVYTTYERRLSPRGSEIYSVRRSRRLTPDRIWRKASSGAA